MTSSLANRGLAWELVLEGWHQRYRVEGRAVIHKTPPPFRVLGRVVKGNFQGRFIGGGPSDYAGIVAGFGPSQRSTVLPVAFDAKDCSEARWSFDKLTEHQAKELEAWQQAGGYAFVALRMGGQGWVLPWSALGPRWHAWSTRAGTAAAGTASVGIEDLQVWGRWMARPGDWLAALP